MGHLTSVIIPSREERWMDKTVTEVKEKFRGPYEIIVVLDGKQKCEVPNGVRTIVHKEPRGMRTSINEAVKIAEGDYIMKLDAHCMLDNEIDMKLYREHYPNWVQIPRRYRLDAHKWEIIPGKFVDYMKIREDFIGQGIRRHIKELIHETETFQGSCYFMERAYFKELGLLDDKNFNGSGNEAQEITLKVWKDGGKIMRNKKTWYAHARTNRYYVTDRSKSREYIKKLAKEYGYRQN